MAKVGLDDCSASFETAAEPVLGPRGMRTRGRLPQGEEFPKAIKRFPHAEPRGRALTHASPQFSLRIFAPGNFVFTTSQVFSRVSKTRRLRSRSASKRA